jgi:hypothetical protein
MPTCRHAKRWLIREIGYERDVEHACDRFEQKPPKESPVKNQCVKYITVEQGITGD